MASEKITRLARERKERLGRRGLNRKGSPVSPPRQIERRYAAELLAMVREIEDEIRRLIIDHLPDWTRERNIYAPRADSWDEDIEHSIRSVKVFGREKAERVVAGLEARARTVEQWNTRTWARSMASVLGVDVFAAGSLGSEFLNQEIGSWARENASLIQSIPDQMLTQVEGIAQRGVRSGENPRDIAREIRGRFGVTESRARLIARDQVSKLNGQLTEARNRSLGIDKYIWATVADERVRTSHEVMNGLLCRWDDDTVYSDDGGKTWNQRSSIGGHEGHPGSDFQCFPGSTQVNGASFYDVVYRRRYSGKLSTIITDEGRILSATPNHPILTVDGFKPINLIRSGDYILGASDKGLSAIKLDTERFIPTFEQLFHAVRNALPADAVSVSSGISGQFHGDGSDAEVEVVTIDGFLISKSYFVALKKLFKLGLAGSDMAICHSVFSGFGNSDFMRIRERNAFGGNMGSLDLMLSLFFRHLSPLEQFSFALCAGSYSGRFESQANSVPGNIEMLGDSVFAVSLLIHGRDLIDWKVKHSDAFRLIPDDVYSRSPHQLAEMVSVNPECFGDLFEGFSFNVELLRVADNFLSDFSGHVYNLQTKTGYYHANKVASSNCRCASIPDLSDLLEEL